jgi:hypothetical protein
VKDARPPLVHRQSAAGPLSINPRVMIDDEKRCSLTSPRLLGAGGLAVCWGFSAVNRDAGWKFRRIVSDHRLAPVDQGLLHPAEGVYYSPNIIHLVLQKIWSEGGPEDSSGRSDNERPGARGLAGLGRRDADRGIWFPSPNAAEAVSLPLIYR